jgi:hypothetical protein
LRGPAAACPALYFIVVSILDSPESAVLCCRSHPMQWTCATRTERKCEPG